MSKWGTVPMSTPSNTMSVSSNTMGTPSNAKSPRIPRALEFLSSQPRVQSFFASALENQRLSHAYLFTGMYSDVMLQAARAVARCVVCPHGGDTTCDECIRVAHGSHPDVREYEPSGTQSYLVDDVRNIMSDAQLAPVRAHARVYILKHVEMLNESSANVLLKTLEEPPANVHFILIARATEDVLPTIVSRCQQVPFRAISEHEARITVERATGADPHQAAIALSIAKTPEAARKMLTSSDRFVVRNLVVRTLSELDQSDAWDVLCRVREILVACDAPLADVKEEQASKEEVYKEFLSSSHYEKLTKHNNRKLQARQRFSIMEALSAAESFLRDVLMAREGLDAHAVNTDVAQSIGRLSRHTSTAAVLAAIEHVRQAADDISHNVAPQLALEAMFISIKEALECKTL